MIVVILVLALILITVDVYFETNFTKLNKVSINTEKPLGEGDIKILQISDYHDFKQNMKVLKLAKDAEADIIVITGDLIDRKTKDYNNVYSFIEALIAINTRIYYVLGNHEQKNKGTRELLEGISRRGVITLSNENTVLEFNKKKLNLIGVDYYYSKHKDINKVLQGLDISLYTILLCHRPGIVKKYIDLSVDLIISGHTHGGQIRLPFIGALLSSGGQLLPKYNKGIYNIFKNTVLYIDSGAGTTRLPIRFLNRSQISLISIVNSNQYKES